MPLHPFRIRTLMIVVAMTGLDCAYLAWADSDSQRLHCGNPMAEWFTINFLALFAYAMGRIFRRWGVANASPPMTTRRWMIAAAAVAFLLVITQNVIYYAPIAKMHRSSARAHARLADWLVVRQAPTRFIRYERAMQAKYERLASFPWLPITLDPPPPQ